jgi:glycosyltransferase involved in cell wall biosynthesis
VSLEGSSAVPAPRTADKIHLSVIIATLNRVGTAQLIGARVRELLASLRVEVLVVTPSLPQSSAPSDATIRYVADPGRGVYGAYAQGLREARGEYIWFIGDDDYPLDAAVQIRGLLEAGAVDVLVAPVLRSNGRISRPQRSLLLLQFLNWCQQGVIYRKRVLARYRFFRRLTVQADQYVNILLRSDPSIRTEYVRNPICVFGVGGISSRVRDVGYRSLRTALAHRTLNALEFMLFRALLCVEPLAKRVAGIKH